MNVEISVVNLLTRLTFTPNMKLLKMFFVSIDYSEKLQKLSKINVEELPTVKDVIMYKCGVSMN